MPFPEVLKKTTKQTIKKLTTLLIFFILIINSNRISSDGYLSCWFMNEYFVIALPLCQKSGKN